MGDNGATIRFRAPDRAGSVTITASGSGCTASITFQIVAPSEVPMRQRADTSLMHTEGRPDLGMQLDIWITPDDVNFHCIHFHEVDAPAHCTGVYSHFEVASHDEHPHTIPMSSNVAAGRGRLSGGRSM